MIRRTSVFSITKSKMIIYCKFSKCFLTDPGYLSINILVKIDLARGDGPVLLGVDTGENDAGDDDKIDLARGDGSVLLGDDMVKMILVMMTLTSTEWLLSFLTL